MSSASDVVLVQCLVEALPMPIASFAAADGQLVLSASECSLLTYSVAESPFSITLTNSKKSACRRPAVQILTIPEASLLLVLLDDQQLQTFSLSNLVLVESIYATKGATAMALFPPASPHQLSARETNTRGLDSTHSISWRLLAVVVKKKLLIYKTGQNSTLRLVKELTVPDRPYILVWLDSNLIAYAHPKRGYFTVTLDTNTVTELYKFPNTLLSAVPSSFGVTATSKLGIAQLPKDRLLLTHGKMGVFVNSDGSELIERDLEWSGIPDFITYSNPYVVAIIGSMLEIRSLTTGGVVQRIDFPQLLQCLSIGGDSLIYTASSNCIWRLLPVSFEDQIEYLIASFQFTEAQRLIEELEFSSEEEKASRLIANIIRVRGLYAHHLFTDENKYEAAISLLSELRASPIDVVNLFPQFSLLGPNSDPPVTDRKALVALKDYLLQQRQILFKLRQLHQHPNTTQAAQPPIVANSVASNNDGGGGSVTVVAKSSLFGGSDQGVPDAVDSLSGVSPAAATLLANAEDTVFLSAVVDTTLLKVYLIVNEGLVGSLVRVENFCDVDVVEAALKDAKVNRLFALANNSHDNKSSQKYRELIDFYYGKGLHRQALEFLTQMNRQSDLVFLPEPIVDYLLKLNINDHTDLFTEFSGPIFESDAETGLKVFTDRYEEIPLRTHLKIMTFFETKSSVLETQYIEHLIGNMHSERPEFHDRLVLLYLQDLVELLSEGSVTFASSVTLGRLFDDELLGKSVDQNRQDSHFLMTRRKLVLFLEKSEFYRPERVFALFPETELLEERTVVLARLNRHGESLKVLVEGLRNNALAQRYCEIYHQRASEPLANSDTNLFMALLGIYLDAVTRGDMPMREVVVFADRYGAQLDAARVVQLMPPTLSIHEMRGFLEKALRRGESEEHLGSVAASAARLEHAKIQEGFIAAQSAFVVLDEDE
ncbi:Vam6/Vps39-like protein, partial [Entophlyctis sp. JEL0112]